MGPEEMVGKKRRKPKYSILDAKDEVERAKGDVGDAEKAELAGTEERHGLCQEEREERGSDGGVKGDAAGTTGAREQKRAGDDGLVERPRNNEPKGMYQPLGMDPDRGPVLHHDERKSGKERPVTARAAEGAEDQSGQRDVEEDAEVGKACKGDHGIT
jgi:hypothetical protein